jgi:hypothetical protein
VRRAADDDVRRGKAVLGEVAMVGEVRVEDAREALAFRA